jgi:antibiotic biosynthesis monooxygenase (ABM) superfamily enzyme
MSVHHSAGLVTTTGAPDGEPVTVLIRRRVKPGREAEYEGWLQRLQVDARSFPGYLGVTTQRPGPSGPGEYLSAVRFESLSSLRAFETSALRHQYLREVAPLVEADAVWETLTGLEFWFSAPPGTVVPQPSRSRMALLMIAVVFTLVLVIGSAVNTLFAALPFATPYPVRLLVTITMEVVLMTWWVMPWLTRRLAHWIYPTRRVA